MSSNEIIALISIMVVAPLAVSAPILTPSIQTSSLACLGSQLPQCLFLNAPPSSGIARLNGSSGSIGSNAFFSVNTMAAASFGILHSQASTSVNVSNTPEIAFTNAIAQFEDIITINFAPFTGQPGTMFLGYTLDGTIASSGQDAAFGAVFAEVGTSLQQSTQVFYSSSFSGSAEFPMAFNFVFGQPFGLLMGLSTASGLITDTSASPTAGLGQGTASANFGNTLILSEIRLEDQGGNPVTAATFSSASGTVYSSDGVVPEPGTFSVVAAAILVGYAFHIRRRRRSPYQVFHAEVKSEGLLK
jgi:hypothetical protein